MKPLIIINPIAGSRTTGFNWLKIKEILDENKYDYDHVFTEYPKHASEIACNEVKNGRTSIIALGGDGTYSEVVNGMMNAGSENDLCIGVIASGTGNDFIRSAKIPNDFEENCRRILKPHYVPIDVGKIEYLKDGVKEKYYFLNACGMGFDAEIINDVQKDIDKKKKHSGSGTMPFVKSLLKVLPSFKPFNVSLKIDKGQPKPMKIMTVVVANGAYFGGGMKIAPDADIRDNLFDVVAIKEIGKARLLRVFPKIYKGKHVNEPEVKQYMGTRIELNGPDYATVQADGEVVCKGSIVVTVEKSALKMMF